LSFKRQGTYMSRMCEEYTHLQMIAELALGLAGFSSIVLVLVQDHAGSALDWLRLRILFQASLAAVFLPLSTLCLGLGGMPCARVWQVGSGFTAFFMIVAASSNLRTIAKKNRATRREAQQATVWVAPPWLLVVGVQVANAAGLLPLPAFLWFLVGLIALLIFSARALVQVVFVRYS
jgi:hypothetical protein